MTTFERCPDCGQSLFGELACTCGWCVEAESEPDVVAGRYRCCYHEKGERCPNPGTICRTIRGNQGKWFCQLHWYHADQGAIT